MVWWNNLDLDTISSPEIPSSTPTCSDSRMSQRWAPKPPKLAKSSPGAPGLQLTSHGASSLQMFASTKASIFVNHKTANKKLSSSTCVSNRVFEAVPTSAGTKKKAFICLRSLAQTRHMSAAAEVTIVQGLMP